ncbi:AMP-binding protein [Kitasatospora sp. NPDC059571]|uniref:AMP-binding protein n=1 Tax=Kitasatospora sp. NPDC059571 TaxID=3346871 RepID=UPI0036C27622
MLAAIGRGIVPVPAATPATTRTEGFARRLRGIVSDCRPALVVTTAAWRGTVRDALGGVHVPGGVYAWPEPGGDTTGPAPAGDGTLMPSPDAPAFLQYTSGSTGAPKGVVISHRALQASCAQAARVYREGPDDVAVTWVPLHHDMGLVTGLLRPLFSGYPSVLMAPEAFARHPGRWLSAITAHGGTLSSAPDFAYALCTRKVTDRELAALDLRTWRVARSAGEVVRAATADRFTARFAAAGLPPRSLCPSYGMAEATLTVTASTPDLPPARLTVRSDALRAGEVAPAAPGEPATVLLSSGTPLPGTEVRVHGSSTGPDGGGPRRRVHPRPGAPRVSGGGAAGPPPAGAPGRCSAPGRPAPRAAARQVGRAAGGRGGRVGEGGGRCGPGRRPEVRGPRGQGEGDRQRAGRDHGRGDHQPAAPDVAAVSAQCGGLRVGEFGAEPCGEPRRRRLRVIIGRHDRGG